ncbi:DNA polymerase beta superfamily protein [Paenibacillus wulumuqiensis]|uniref:DNA polymerase beta superfamily protein n=1 Tax=Paenibacillus wulumuqiensis TaxID=1567107 RepID=UPI001F40AF18|nr:nucleotidyltransferase domain-containing protein [Paenibacillus wulumuqiensis]
MQVSQAWGFPSRDSDYDVRFIYVHPPEWYLSIFDRRDVIEYPISDQLDINGWDSRLLLDRAKRHHATNGIPAAGRRAAAGWSAARGYPSSAGT